MSVDFRCAAASARDLEPLAGTAPTEKSWLFIEYAGAWGRNAVEDSRLPTEVRDKLASLSEPRVQLIRRYGGSGGPGVQVYRAELAERPQVFAALLDDVRQLLSVESLPWTEHQDPLWLVCTNGGRDRCCTEFGRPVAARLSQEWPAETWETTHLGGHRFSGTMLALPAGVVLGRLDPDSAAEAVAHVLADRLPLDSMRGRSGWSARAQVADLHVRHRLGLHDVDAVHLVAEEGGRVTLATPSGRWLVDVAAEPGPAQQQSCREVAAKPSTRYDVTAVSPA